MLKNIIIAVTLATLLIGFVSLVFIQTDKAIQNQKTKQEKQLQQINQYRQEALKINQGEYIE